MQVQPVFSPFFFLRCFHRLIQSHHGMKTLALAENQRGFNMGHDAGLMR